MSEKLIPVEMEIPKSAIREIFENANEERLKEIVKSMTETSDVEEFLSQIIVKALEFYFYKKGKQPKP